MTAPRRITRTLLGRMPLPALDADGDKAVRGRVLVVGGSEGVPGAVLLAGVAALRAGAGMLQLATVRRAALPLGLAVPEALVVGLPTTSTGQIAGSKCRSLLEPHASSADAVLVGPGMSDGRGVPALVGAVRGLLSREAVLVLDSAAIFALRRDEHMLMMLGGRAVITPHEGEMATLLGVDKREVEGNRRDVAVLAAQRFGVVVALKGSSSWIATPDGEVLRYDDGSVGLATSGSGDTLAGILAGLAARGAAPERAAAWAVWAHGTAGERLTRKTGEVGFLARELLAELPALVGRRGSRR